MHCGLRLSLILLAAFALCLPAALPAGAQEAADLSVTKVDTPDPVTAGTNLTYTITVTNAGPSDAATVSLSDTLPTGTRFVSLSPPGGWSCTTPAVGADGTVSCSISSLGVGSAIFTLTVAVHSATNPGTVLSNTATVSSATSDPNPDNESDTATTTVEASADLTVEKSAPSSVLIGGKILYLIEISSNGPSAAYDVTMNDALPAGTTFVSVQPSGSCTTPPVGMGGTVSCSGLIAGTTGTDITLEVKVNSDVAPGTVLSNTVIVSSPTPDPNPGNESDTATTIVEETADLSVTKVDNPDPVAPAANLVYTITVNNSGPNAATGVHFVDPLPPGTTFVSLSAPAGWSCFTPPVGTNDSLSCSISSLGLGSAVFTLTVAVDAGVAPGTQLLNTAAGFAENDVGEDNDSDSATTTVAALPSLSVTKTDNPDPVLAGANLTFTITVTNPGPDGQDVGLSDPLLDHVTFQSLSAPPGWTCMTPTVGMNGMVSCFNPSFAPGSAVFTLTVKVDADTPAGTVLSNTATVTWDAASKFVTATETTTVATQPSSVEIPTLDELGLAILAALLTLSAAWALRRRET
jgi:uncharacterized repeat protein (TIGR01451 family)